LAYNKPSFDSTKFSLGPAIVSIGATGATPSTDLGAVESAGFELISEVEDVFLGAPQVLVAVLPSREEATMTWTLMEWEIQNFARAIGAGITTATSYRFGAGDVAKQQFSTLFQHRVQGSGDTFEVRIWKAIPAGNLPVTLDSSQTLFEMTFRALNTDGLNWRSETVDEYLEIAQIAAP
jgi:hypothetical protein